MLPACSSSLVSSSHCYDETITNRHLRNDAAACVRCVLHPLPLPLSSCLGCIPPLIGLPFLRFDAVVSSLYLLFVFCIFLSIATMSFAAYFLVRSIMSAFPAYPRTFFRSDFVRFRLSCDHGWIRSGSVNHCILYIFYSCLFKCPSFSTFFCFPPYDSLLYCNPEFLLIV